MDEPQAPVRPEPDVDEGDPVAVRTFLIAAFVIVLGMILWALSMQGY